MASEGDKKLPEEDKKLPAKDTKFPGKLNFDEEDSDVVEENTALDTTYAHNIEYYQKSGWMKKKQDEKRETLEEIYEVKQFLKKHKATLENDPNPHYKRHMRAYKGALKKKYNTTKAQYDKLDNMMTVEPIVDTLNQYSNSLDLKVDTDDLSTKSYQYDSDEEVDEE